MTILLNPDKVIIKYFTMKNIQCYTVRTRGWGFKMLDTIKLTIFRCRYRCKCRLFLLRTLSRTYVYIVHESKYIRLKSLIKRSPIRKI